MATGTTTRVFLARLAGITVLDPNGEQPVYIATSRYTFVANGRIYVSNNRGGTWTHLELPFPLGGNNPGRAMGERLMVDRNLPSTPLHGSRTAGL